MKNIFFKPKKQLAVLLKKKDGMAQIELLVTLLVVMIGLALLINVFAVVIDYSKAVIYTDALVDNAQVYGKLETDPDANDQLATQVGLDPSQIAACWDAQYFDSATKKLAFEKPFTAHITVSCRLPLFFSTSQQSVLSLSLPVVRKGSSEVFWK